MTPLSARLFTVDGQTVVVPEVPVPPPATGGRIAVEIPYPEREKPGTVYRVAVINGDTGAIMRRSLDPVVTVLPGDTLTVSFGEEDISAALLDYLLVGFHGAAGDGATSCHEVSDEALFPSRDEVDWSVLRDLDRPHPLVNNSWQPPEGIDDPGWVTEMFYEMRNVHHLLDMAGVPHGYSMDTRSIDCRVLLLVLAFKRLRGE